MNHYNMLVIGSGPSGRRAAVQSAKLGKSVMVVGSYGHYPLKNTS
jgi:NAD(P) transhydrogenase